MAQAPYIRVDHQARLQFGPTEVVIGTPFVLVADGFQHALDPEKRHALGPLLGIYPDRLVKEAVDADGTLSLRFAGGAVLSVPPHPQHEAWQVNGPGNRLVVCSPSGEHLAVWE
jgi:hypothetical protein